MKRTCDVLIVGGGVIGLTTAYYLARDGVRVSVVDKGELGREASWAGAGIIPPGNPDHAGHAVDRLRAESAQQFPVLSAELQQQTGFANGYTLCGGAELDSGIDEEVLAAWQAEQIAAVRVLRHEWGQLEPAFAEIKEGGYSLPGMAQVRNPWHLRALAAACRALGVEFMTGCEVLRFEPLHASRIQAAITTDDQQLIASQFLVAAGAWTDRLLEPLGWRPGIFPVRGQIVLFNPGTVLFRTILLRGKCYLVPRQDGRVLAGSTEENVGFEKKTTGEAIAALTEMAYTLVPALRAAQIEATWCGLRPATNDGLPYLGLVPDTANVYVAAGHFRAGVQLSPATGLVLAQLLQVRAPAIPIGELALDRPARPAYRSAFHS